MWKKWGRVTLLSVMAGLSGLGTAALLWGGVAIVSQPRTATPAPPPPAPPDTLHAVPSANDAVEGAAEDAKALVLQGHEGDLAFIRWVWVESGDDEDAAVVNWTLNKASRSPFLHAGAVIRSHGATLVRVDLREYAPQPDDLREWLGLWEDFRFDPAFSLLITRDTLKLLRIPEGDLPKVKKKVKRQVVKKEPFKRTEKRQVTRRLTTPYIDAQGRFHDTVTREEDVEVDDVREVTEDVTDEVEVPATEGDDFAVVRLNSRAIWRDDFEGLQRLTQTEAPVVESRYFETRALSTIKDANVNAVFATIWAGEYYDFRGIRRSKGKGKTDLTLFLESLGLVDADRFFERQRSDQRAALFHSGITDKPRRVDFERSPSGRQTTGFLSVTHDFFDANIDIGSDPIANLLRVKADAFEVRAEGPNGTILDALFDGDEKLLDEAGASVVAAHNHPAPHTRRLQGAIDCEICHGDAGGWKPVHNSVREMLRHGFTPFGDLSALERTIPDVRDRLLGLYGGEDYDIDLQFSRARDDQARVFLRAGGHLWKDDAGQVDTVKYLTRRLEANYSSFNYGTVDAGQALADLGVHAPAGKELATLQALLPPDPDGRVGGDYPEDFRISGLLSGEAIGVRSWQLARSFAAARVQKRLAAFWAAQNPQPN